MVYTYNPGTSIGQIRMLCLDKGSESPFGDWVYTDAEISAYYEIEGDIRLAAASALEDLANNQAILTKVKKVGDIELTSGVDIAKQFMSRADRLRASVENGSYFGAVEFQ